jgi:DNA repair protein RecO
MRKERIIESFILKRTDYGEADQIITLFSKEEGKVRALVKAAKLPTSKLQPLMQPLFETRVSLTGNKDAVGLSKVINVQLIKAYSGILETESKLAAWYVVSELLIRALPDSAPNESLFVELEQYANFLHCTEMEAETVKQSVIQFQIKALATLGLGIRAFTSTSAPLASHEGLWFSIDRGGFINEDSVDAIPIRWEVFQSFQILAENSYARGIDVAPTDLGLLSNLINRFVIHQLERDIKSHQLLAST